ncbi:hypothetical protein K1718_00140 [Roseibium porphyridii]|uniref:DUF6985 domain-containing protein n=1 Tax=Roseibium porphyridii TaxID=2866279 RepID=A0ABY8F368_9HYPH|nr:hypothetical protein [Roseibium sp. KMA01]WFE89806.1 hypothetical protein K1718_00140 [Roseibium sp. KMA01]
MTESASRNPFFTNILGSVNPGDGHFIWQAKSQTVPMLENIQLPVILTKVNERHVNAIDEAIAQFLKLGDFARDEAGRSVHADFLKLTAAPAHLTGDAMSRLAIERPDDVWQHLRPQSLWLTAERYEGEETIYIAIHCDCDWDPEDGIQLVYREGKLLTRVSEQDGEVEIEAF